MASLQQSCTLVIKLSISDVTSVRVEYFLPPFGKKVVKYLPIQGCLYLPFLLPPYQDIRRSSLAYKNILYFDLEVVFCQSMYDLGVNVVVAYSLVFLVLVGRQK